MPNRIWIEFYFFLSNRQSDGRRTLPCVLLCSCPCLCQRSIITHTRLRSHNDHNIKAHRMCLVSWRGGGGGRRGHRCSLWLRTDILGMVSISICIHKSGHLEIIYGAASEINGWMAGYLTIWSLNRWNRERERICVRVRVLLNVVYTAENGRRRQFSVILRSERKNNKI